MPILPFIYTARIAKGAIRMMRSTSRSTPRNIAALLLCPLLLWPAAVRAQSDTPAAQSAPSLANPQADQSNPLHTASRTELDVVKVLVAQERAWNAGDIDGFVKGYKDSPETIFIGKQESKGYQQILDDYRHNFATRASMGNLVYSEIEVTELSDTFAICTGRYHLDRTRKEGGPADGLFSLVLEKTDQGWKIVLDHTT
ncbi:MAG TPA: nuclear transport factor 2 family protein [Acidobacteriaceae bacterium]|nr:nuclear transport factor 2 family protein [Acidobacteriaceae bacterium]